MENKELRQLENTVEIVGTLKTIDLEAKVSRNGNPYIGGELVVSSRIEDKVHEIRVKVFIMKTSKLYKGAETVMNEYKSIDEHGRENADRIRIQGELTLNQYINRNDKLVQFNEVKGVFFNRLDEENGEVQDKALASIETVIQGFDPILDADNLPTGDYSVKGFTVAWGNTVVDLHNMIVKEELSEAFMNLYQPGSTGRLSININNYVEIVEQEEVEAPTEHGFGSTETVEATVIDKFVSNLEIIGGDVPFFGTKEYTPEEIDLAVKTSQLAIQSLEAPAPATPPTNTNTGFGQGAPSQNVENQMPTGMSSDDEMPDF